jgi:predicted naringenin-chalcone synthase
MEIEPQKLQVSRDVLCRFGNMSSATVLFILESLLAQNAAAPCVMLGFGPGLVAEAALLL